MKTLSYLKDRHKQYMAGLAQDQYGTARSDLGLAVDALEQADVTARLYDAELNHSEAMRKRIEQLEAALKFVAKEIGPIDGTMKAWLIIGEALETTEDTALCDHPGITRKWHCTKCDAEITATDKYTEGGL